MKTKNIITGVLLISFVVVVQQSITASEGPNDVYSELRTHLNQTRDQAVVSVFPSSDQLKAADPDKVLALLAEYENDPHLGVRHRVLYYEYELARLQPQLEIRRQVTTRLVKAMVDPCDDSMLSPASNYLLHFEADDFSEFAKQMIGSALRHDSENTKVILVCGVANIQEELPYLKDLLIDELVYQAEADQSGEDEWYFTVGWSARLARARMGIYEDVQTCIELVDYEINHGGYFEGRGRTPVTRLLSDVGYVAQPAAVRYLQQYLVSERRLRPTNPGAPGEPVANYVMSILAERLRNFPAKAKKGRGYTSAETQLCHGWMVQQKEWDIKR